MVRLFVGMIVAVSVCGLCSCAQPAAGAPARVAEGFVTALRAGDGSRACTLLTHRARSSAAGATDVSCAAAVANLPDTDTAVRWVRVWGDAAQVRIGSDVVFLRRLPAGWRISAAGCTPRGHRPYDCDVQG